MTGHGEPTTAWTEYAPRTEYGLWTKEGGGVLDTAFYSIEAAAQALIEYLTDDPRNALDLTVIQVCDLHNDQPVDYCTDCAKEAGG